MCKCKYSHIILLFAASPANQRAASWKQSMKPASKQAASPTSLPVSIPDSMCLPVVISGPEVAWLA